MAYLKFSDELRYWAKSRGCDLEVAYVIDCIADGCDMTAHEIWEYQTSLTEWAVRGYMTELVRLGQIEERDSYAWGDGFDPFRLLHTPSRWHGYGNQVPTPADKN